MFFGFTTTAQAADRYWVGGCSTANWSCSDAGPVTNWGSVSNTRDSVSVPGASDDVFFDGVGTGNSPSTLSASQSVKSLDMTGYANTLTHASAVTLTVAGNGVVFKLASGMTYTLGNAATAAITFTGTSGTTQITTAGKTIGNITFNGSGGTFQLQDEATTTGIVFNRTNGTFDPNGHTVAFTSAGIVVVTSIPTFYNMTSAKAGVISFTTSSTITNTLTLNGASSTSRLLVQSNTIGTPVTLTASTTAISNADFRDITGAGTGNWDLRAITGLSGDSLGNSGITFTASTTQTWQTAAGGDWSVLANWTSRVPLPQDDVNLGIAYGTSKTVTIDMPRLGRNINWTGATWTTSLALQTQVTSTIYGSLILVPGINQTSTGSMFFEGRATSTLTSAGVIWSCSHTIQMPGGTFQLQDDLIKRPTSILTLTAGTFDANNFNVTIPIFLSRSGNRTVKMGNGIWTLTGEGNLWFAASSISVVPGDSTIVITSTSTTAKTFVGAGKAYNNITISGDNVKIGNSGDPSDNTFLGTMAVNNAGLPNGLIFYHGSTQTVANFTTNATTTTARAIIKSDSAAAATLAKSGGGTVSVDYMNPTWITGTPASTWYVGADSLDGGNNSGLIFSTLAIVPTLTTSAPTLVSTSTMTLNANISATGNASITQSGFAYGTVSDLSTLIATTSLGSQGGTGDFSGNLTGLTPNTPYYFRAYAVNSAGTSTGAILSTTTLQWSVSGAPTSASAATSSANQATVSFTAPASNGGSSILYYLASSTPGNFTATSTASPIIVTGLSNGTSYTFAVYAVNAVGTSSPSSPASNAVTPTAGIPLVATPTVSTTTLTATFSSNITDIGIGNPTIRGFEYGTSTSYGTIISSTSPSFGTGAFSQSINTSWLSCSTVYHYRAFATNSFGTASSTDASFITNSCNALNSGLIGWWRFDDGSGTNAVDSSGNGNNGTLFTFPPNGSGWVTGQLGTALSFDGVGTYVKVNNQMISDSQDGSYSIWAYNLPTNSTQQLMTQEMGSSANNCYGLLYIDGDLKYMQTNGGAFQAGDYTYDLSGKWTNIIVSWNTTDAYLYINGIQVSSGERGICTQTIQPRFYIGRGPSAYYTSGYLDDVRVYNRQLSDQDVYFLYQEGVNTWGNTPATNHNPIVIAGSDQTIALPATATLSGTTTDDGLPVGSNLTTTWSHISGPAQAYFSATTSLNTLATFSTAGTYVLRLTASDSDLASTSDVTITVNPIDVTPPVLSNSYPTYTLSASTTQTAFWVTTDEKAVCKYGTTPGVAYASQANNYDYDNGVTHRKLLTGLSAGNSYTYYVRCQDTAVALNTNSSDYTVSFSIATATTSSRSLYVSTTGSSGGDGSIGSPWDLATALNPNLSHARAGDTIYLRDGVYDSTFTSTLLGSTTGQVTVMSYPGEWAIVNGGITQTSGGYTTYRDFEITQAYTPSLNRVSATSGSVPAEDIGGEAGGGGFNVGASGLTRGVKVINLVIHDTRNSGLGLWSNAPDLEAYGNIIYHIGWDAPDRGHGHGIYTQNTTGIKIIADNITFDEDGGTGGYGIHAYAQGASLRNFDFDGNVIFDSEFLVGGYQPYSNILLEHNMIGEGGSLSLGYSSPTNTDAVLDSNYLSGSSIIRWSNLLFRNNNFFDGVTIYLESGDDMSGYQIDNNAYYAGAHDIYQRNGLRLAANLSAWQALGFDTNGSYSSSHPVSPNIIVRPNKYQPGRANIVVYNWAQASTVSVDLSSVLNPGDSYEIRDAQNYLGTPISSGTYAGGTVSVSMTGTTVSDFTGDWTGATHHVAATHTSSAFGAFVVLKTTGSISTPTILQVSLSSITTTTATASSTITATGGANATVRGFAYGTDATFTTVIATSTESGDFGIGAYSAPLSNLTCNTIYYVRAYAVNSVGTTTATSQNFTTTACVPSVPTSITAATSSPNQATISFTPGSNGGSDILYYLASSTPGNFTATSTGSPIVVSGLTNGTSYTFAVYAVNAVGTSTPSSASNAVTPTAAIVAPTVTNQVVSSIAATTATGNGNITVTGNINPTIRGVVYGTSLSYGATTTPETGDFTTGAFTSSITGLTCDTPYHVAAYATNSQGTGYGSDVTFTTSACPVTTTTSSTGGSVVYLLPPTVKYELSQPNSFASYLASQNKVLTILEQIFSEAKAIMSGKAETRLTDFINNGTASTKILGSGKRAGVLNSYQLAFGKSPQTESDWVDLLKIANGRWPSQRSKTAEDRAIINFRKVYLRNPDRFNSHDDAAITIMAYGLRPAMRNLNSERAAIKTFGAIYGYNPSTVRAWDVVRAIAYSGAKR